MNKIRKVLSFSIAILAWFAVIMQYYLMQKGNYLIPISDAETTIRFFSYFTILTNTLVAISFSIISFIILKHNVNYKSISSKLTAITVYITIVGLVYQFILRFTWNPTGIQKVVDELLHSLIPLFVILFWLSVRTKLKLRYDFLFSWLTFPVVYLIYVLSRGYFSGFYPYPFLDISKIGLMQTLINSAVMLVLFITVSVFYLWLSKIKNSLKFKSI